MKKILLVTMLVCAISKVAFAGSAVDYKTDTVTVSGNADGRVGITVFCPGMWFENIAEGVFSNSVVSCNMQTTASAEGKYSFSFRQKGVTGIYRYLVSSDKGDSEEDSFVFVSTTDRNTIVNALNGAAQSAVAGICDTYKTELEISGGAFANADRETAAAVIADSIGKSPFDASDFRFVSDTVKAAYQTGAIAAGKVGDLNETECVYSFVDNRISKWMRSDKITDLRKNAIISALNGSYTSFDGLSDNFAERLVLYIVGQPNGLSNLKEVISDFQSEIGVDASAISDSIYSNVSGTLYGSYAELRQALAAQTNTGTQSGPVGGGGGGGGGGGAAIKPSENNDADPVPADNINKDEDKKVDHTPVGYIMKFEDIDSVSWAQEAIASLARDGIVSGKSDTVFDPMGNVTREEFVKMLIGVLKTDITEYGGEYGDVKSDAWYAGYVAAATANKLCQGIGDGLFGVGLPITRQDMCVMIYNAITDGTALSGKENGFVDSDRIANYAKDAVSTLAALDLVHGNDSKEFLPANNTTRAEAAVLLNSLKNYLEGGAD